jgi:hypothetical protein
MILVNIEQECEINVAAPAATPTNPAPRIKQTLLGAAVAPELLEP